MRPIVFIHGVKGGKLADADGEIAWLGLWQALDLSTPTLALPARYDGDAQARDDLRPAGILDRIRVLGDLVSVDIYGTFLEEMTEASSRFHPFSYDWRRDPNEAVEAFASFLADVKSKDGAAPLVVAHSMGGLVTLAVMNERPELFASVVLAGAPVKGGIGFLPDVHVGSDNGLNAEILSDEVLATFPAFFSVYPLVSDNLIDAQGQQIPVDFYAPADWERLAIGPFAAGKAPTAEYRSFFVRMLAGAKRFRERLAHRISNYPPVLVVASQAHATMVQAMRAGPKSERGWDFASTRRVPGDGRVAFTNVELDGIPHTKLLTEEDHTTLLNDPAVIARIKELAQ